MKTIRLVDKMNGKATYYNVTEIVKNGCYLLLYNGGKCIASIDEFYYQISIKR